MCCQSYKFKTGFAIDCGKCVKTTLISSSANIKKAGMANPGFICLLFNCTHVSSGNSDLNYRITAQNIIYFLQSLLQP